MKEKWKEVIGALSTIGKHSDGSEDFAANRANLEYMLVSSVFVGGICVGMIGFVGYILETVK